MKEIFAFAFILQLKEIDDGGPNKKIISQNICTKKNIMIIRYDVTCMM